MGLLSRRTAGVDQRFVTLADELPARRDAVRAAEQQLEDSVRTGSGPDEDARLRRTLDRALTAAYESADAAYRVVLGPVEGMKRTKYLRRLRRPEVVAADQARREIALARSHYQMAMRDDLGVVAPAAVPPSVGTRAITLGTHADGH